MKKEQFNQIVELIVLIAGFLFLVFNFHNLGCSKEPPTEPPSPDPIIDVVYDIWGTIDRSPGNHYRVVVNDETVIDTVLNVIGDGEVFLGQIRVPCGAGYEMSSSGSGSKIRSEVISTDKRAAFPKQVFYVTETLHFSRKRIKNEL